MILIAVGLMAATLSATDASATPPTPATPAVAATPATAPTPPTTVAAADPQDQMICHRQAEIGTRLGSSKICKTRREWNAGDRDSQDVLNAAQKRSFAYGPKGS